MYQLLQTNNLELRTLNLELYSFRIRLNRYFLEFLSLVLQAISLSGLFLTSVCFRASPAFPLDEPLKHRYSKFSFLPKRSHCFFYYFYPPPSRQCSRLSNYNFITEKRIAFFRAEHPFARCSAACIPNRTAKKRQTEPLLI